MNKEKNSSKKCPICGRPTHKKSKYCIFHASAEEKTEEEFKEALKTYIDHIKKEDFAYDFKGFVFIGKIDFKKDMKINVFKNANFGSSVFKGCSIFSESTFKGYTNFGKVFFEDYSNFFSVTFNDYVYFGEALFAKLVSFNFAHFKSKVFFGNTLFKEKAQFHNTLFKEIAYFGHAYFEKEACFDEAIFKAKLSFVNARFLKPEELLSTLRLNLKFKEETYLKDLDDFFTLFRSIYMKIFYIYKFSNKEKQKIRENIKLSDIADKEFEYFKKNYFKINKKSKPRLKAIKVSSPGFIDIVALTSVLGIIFLSLQIYESSQKIKINKLEIDSRELKNQKKELEFEDYKKFISIKNKMYNQMNRELIDKDLEKNLEELGKNIKNSDLK